MKTPARLFARFLDGLPQGKVAWVAVRLAHKEPMLVSTKVTAIAGLGVEGGRRCKGVSTHLGPM